MYSNTAKEFRELDSEMLVKYNLKKEFADLEKNFPSIRLKREEIVYNPIVAPTNAHIITSPLQDVFEFITIVLNHDKKGCEKLSLDPETFTINSLIQSENEIDVGLMITLYKADKGQTVVEFIKTLGE